MEFYTPFPLSTATNDGLVWDLRIQFGPIWGGCFNMRGMELPSGKLT